MRKKERGESETQREKETKETDRRTDRETETETGIATETDRANRQLSGKRLGLS